MRSLLDSTKTGHAAQVLESGLKNLIVGQDKAIEQIVNIYQMHLTGLTPSNRPIANFLFLGPTGSGKTRIVEAVAETLVGDARALIKVDCAEFQHSHEIAKLIGSPPGYLGHRETRPLLCQETLNRFHLPSLKISLVLFDEIEKASDALWNLLLGILDKATLTLGDNRRVDFSRAMIFMTSNVGAAQISALTRPGLGFAGAVPSAGLPDKTSRTGLDAARRKFTPEFINRIDKIVAFKPLGEPELRRVLEIELKAVQQRIFSDCGSPFGFTIGAAARARLLAEGTDAQYGARHLKRAVERLLVQPMSNLVASRQVATGDWLSIDYDAEAGRIVFQKEAEGLPALSMAARAGIAVPGCDAIRDVAVASCPASLAYVPSPEVIFGE